jgi:hypothetical protein
MDSAKSAAIYYSASFISGLMLVSFLIHLFQWPITASLVFGVSLFIQYMYLSRKVFLYLKMLNKNGSGLNELLRNLSEATSMKQKVESDV